MKTVTATQMARNAGEVLDAVATRGETVVVERHHAAIARIVPAEPTRTLRQVLDDMRPMLTASQAAAWLKASRARGLAEAVRDPWA
jgi:antitoxin (DNA-binding transcriptional repressor) of toxin-antitoxin stability system